jgi:MGT family glycosyltransferase
MRRVDRVLVLTSPWLDYPEERLPRHVRYVGPAFDSDAALSWSSPWPPDHPDPLVVVTLSYLFQVEDAAVQRVLDVLGELPVRVLLLGKEAATVHLQVPPNAVVRGWVPHTAVLPEASLVVTHGGIGTMTGALAHGVPLLCLPLWPEQRWNSARAEQIGAARVVSGDAPTAEIRAAIDSLLGSTSYRTAAAQAAARTERDGCERAVERLEGMLGGRVRRLLRRAR